MKNMFQKTIKRLVGFGRRLQQAWLKRRQKKKANRVDTSDFTMKDYGSVLLRVLKMMVDFGYIVILGFFFLGAGLGFGYFASQVKDVAIPSQSELVSQVNNISRVSKMTYANGNLISEVDSDLLRTPVESDAISDNVKNAIIATEDENYQSHNGVVPKAVFRALLSSLLGLGESSGGSTVTQQLMKQQILGDDPTFKRKAREILYALAAERYMSKAEILTAYLNVSPFGRNNKGQNIAGVEEAAQGIFGKSAKDLTIPQAAFIAGLPQSPIVYSPYAADGSLKSTENMQYGINRQKDVLYNMYRAGYINKSDYDNYVAYDISQDFLAPGTATTNSHDYLYYAVYNEAVDVMYDYLVQRDNVSENDLKNDSTKESYRQLAQQAVSQGGYTISTTINQKIYTAMNNTAASQASIFDNSNGQAEVGNVLMDNKTGAILGFVGGRNYSNNQNNHAFDTERSPGSSIKPILAYGIAVDQGLMGSASMLSNYPTTFTGGTKIMHAGDEGTTMVTFQEALNTSWNIPAFWTYKMLQQQGVDVASYMTKMGYTIRDYNIESLPLGGGIETSVLTQTNAYQTLANGGQYLKHYMVDKITDPDGNVIYQHEANPVQVYSKATASIMTNMLREVITKNGTTRFYERVTALNSNMNNIDWVGKTGTTDNTTDVWLVLSTPDITLSGWAGFDDNSSLEGRAGWDYNSTYMAQMANAIYNADSSVFSTDKFTYDSSAIKSTVLTSTGEKAATVTVNNKSVNLSGDTTTSYWAKNGAPDTTYKFAIGGTDSDYVKAWQAILGSNY